MKYSHDSTPDDWSWLDELGELDPSFLEAIQQLRALDDVPPAATFKVLT